jgi:hypothetical protein
MFNKVLLLNVHMFQVPMIENDVIIIFDRGCFSMSPVLEGLATPIPLSAVTLLAILLPLKCINLVLHVLNLEPILLEPSILLQYD